MPWILLRGARQLMSRRLQWTGLRGDLTMLLIRLDWRVVMDGKAHVWTGGSKQAPTCRRNLENTWGTTETPKIRTGQLSTLITIFRFLTLRLDLSTHAGRHKGYGASLCQRSFEVRGSPVVGINILWTGLRRNQASGNQKLKGVWVRQDSARLSHGKWELHLRVSLLVVPLATSRSGLVCQRILGIKIAYQSILGGGRDPTANGRIKRLHVSQR